MTVRVSLPIKIDRLPPGVVDDDGLRAAWAALTTRTGCARPGVVLAVYDLARAVVDEAAGHAFGEVQGGDTVEAALARLVAAANGRAGAP